MLSTGWFGTDLGLYRPCDGTYEHYATATLPRLPVLTGTFGWLDAELDPDIEYAGEFSPGPLPHGLPQSFVDFCGRPALARAVPSCTACWWEESLAESASPLGDGATLVRFLNDQQGCLFWYLYLWPDGTHAVVCGGLRYDDASLSVTADQAAADLVIVAQDFEQFLYRFWIENLAWFLVVDQEREWDGLPEAVAEYLTHYRSS